MLMKKGVLSLKKWFIFAGLCTVMTLTGCAASDSANRGIYERSGNTLNVNTKRTDLYHEGEARRIRNVSHNYGYVRHQADPTKSANNQSRYAALNREQLANIISRLSTGIPKVHDVATLVTDQEVLISYQTSSKDRNTTADQVKRTAMSVVPRYYHVYVSDNKHLVKDVENLSHLDSTSKNARDLINRVVEKMKKSPQGAPVSQNENANGETADETGSKPKD